MLVFSFSLTKLSSKEDLATSCKLLASSDQIRPKGAESLKGMTREWAMVTGKGGFGMFQKLWERNVAVAMVLSK